MTLLNHLNNKKLGFTIDITIPIRQVLGNLNIGCWILLSILFMVMKDNIC